MSQFLSLNFEIWKKSSILLSSGISTYQSKKEIFSRSFQHCEAKIVNKSEIEKRPIAVRRFKYRESKTLNSVQYYWNLGSLSNTLIECNISGISAFVILEGENSNAIELKQPIVFSKLQCTESSLYWLKVQLLQPFRSEIWETVEIFDNFGTVKLDWGILDEEIEWTSL